MLGGQDSSGTAVPTAERYLPETNAWSVVSPMSAPRFGHGAAFVRQSIVVAGGATTGGAGESAAEYLDPARGAWSPRSSLSREHIFGAAVAIGGRVFVAGGLNAAGQAQSTLDTFVHGDFWLQGPSMPTPREATVAGQIGGMIYVAGGFKGGAKGKNGLVTTNERYDPATATWATMAPLPLIRAHAMGAVADGEFYVIGGNNVSPPDRKFTNTVFAYDPTTNRWTAKAPLPLSGAWGGTAASIDNVIYVTAGSDGGDMITNDPRGDVFAYDPARDVWRPIPKLPDGTLGASAAALHGMFYLTGGNGAAAARADLRSYDPRTGLWTTGPTAPVATTFLTTVAARGALFAISGGDRQTYALPLTQRYDPASQTWTKVTPIPEGVVSTSSAESDGIIYVFGGRSVLKRVTGKVFVYVP